jgi:hypothetical protein
VLTEAVLDMALTYSGPWTQSPPTMVASTSAAASASGPPGGADDARPGNARSADGARSGLGAFTPRS